MSDILEGLLKLNGKISNRNSDSFIYKIYVSNENVALLRLIFDNNLVEAFRDAANQLTNVGNLENLIGKEISIEFVIAELKKIGYYLYKSDFITSNRIEAPSIYYIEELKFLSSSNEDNVEIQKYQSVVSLITSLISKARFVSDENHKILYLVQDNSFLELPIENVVYENNFEYEDISFISEYVQSIDSYQEKKTIFIKELIDFLSTKVKSERLTELLINFRSFLDRCNTSFEYYLSNFSFNKIRLELDNSVLEYSKSIRSIINDSQSKLIAIPAAFVLAFSQVNFANPYVLKNILLVISCFLFSYIISIFIKNQNNALDIVQDNIENYKVNYKRSVSNRLEGEKDLTSLTALITKSFAKIDGELQQQNKRLRILQICNWGISIILTATVLLAIYLHSDINLATFDNWIMDAFVPKN